MEDKMNNTKRIVYHQAEHGAGGGETYPRRPRPLSSPHGNTGRLYQRISKKNAHSQWEKAIEALKIKRGGRVMYITATYHYSKGMIYVPPTEDEIGDWGLTGRNVFKANYKSPVRDLLNKKLRVVITPESNWENLLAYIDSTDRMELESSSEESGIKNIKRIDKKGRPLPPLEVILLENAPV